MQNFGHWSLAIYMMNKSIRNFHWIWVTWLTMSAQQLTLLIVVRYKSLCQAPPPWRHNALSWWRHIQNITRFGILSPTWPVVNAAAAYSRRNVWRTVSRNNTDLLSYHHQQHQHDYHNHRHQQRQRHRHNCDRGSYGYCYHRCSKKRNVSPKWVNSTEINEID